MRCPGKCAAGSSPLRCPGGSRLRPGSTGPAPSTESWSTRPPSTCAVPRCPPSHPRWGSHPPAVRGPAHRRPGITEPVRLRAGGHAPTAQLADLRGRRRGHRRSRRRARPPGAARVRQGCQDRPGAAAARGRAGHRPRGRRPRARSYAARNSWIRLLMSEGAGPSRSSRRLDQLGLRSGPAVVWHPVHLLLGHAAAAVRAP